MVKAHALMWLRVNDLLTYYMQGFAENVPGSTVSTHDRLRELWTGCWSWSAPKWEICSLNDNSSALSYSPHAQAMTHHSLGVGTSGCVTAALHGSYWVYEAYPRYNQLVHCS